MNKATPARFLLFANPDIVGSGTKRVNLDIVICIKVIIPVQMVLKGLLSKLYKDESYKFYLKRKMVVKKKKKNRNRGTILISTTSYIFTENCKSCSTVPGRIFVLLRKN